MNAEKVQETKTKSDHGVRNNFEKVENQLRDWLSVNGAVESLNSQQKKSEVRKSWVRVVRSKVIALVYGDCPIGASL